MNTTALLFRRRSFKMQLPVLKMPSSNTVLAACLKFAMVTLAILALASGAVAEKNGKENRTKTEKISNNIKKLKKTCKLRREEIDIIREKSRKLAGTGADGRRRTLDQAIKDAHNYIYMIRAIQDGIEGAIRTQDGYKDWTVRQIDDDKLFDPDKDSRRIRDGIGKITRSLLEKHPIGNVINKVAKAVEKINKYQVKIMVRSMYSDMLARGTAHVRELIELHSAYSAKIKVLIARKNKLKKLKSESDEAWKRWAEIEIRLRKLAYGSAKLERAFDNNGDCIEYRKHRECPECWSKKGHRSVDGQPNPVKSKKCRRSGLLGGVKCVKEKMGE